MKNALMAVLVTLLLAACGQGTATSMASPSPIQRSQSSATPSLTHPSNAVWSLPVEKYVFVEHWIELYNYSGYLDFPTYAFSRESGELKPYIVPSGRWFPLSDLTPLKVVIGNGISVESGGSGARSEIIAVTELPFTNTWLSGLESGDAEIILENVDTQGVVYLQRNGEPIELHPGENWQWKQVMPDSVELVARLSNYGIFDKARIQLVKEQK